LSIPHTVASKQLWLSVFIGIVVSLIIGVLLFCLFILSIDTWCPKQYMQYFEPNSGFSGGFSCIITPNTALTEYAFFISAFSSLAIAVGLPVYNAARGKWLVAFLSTLVWLSLFFSIAMYIMATASDLRP
jgi:archaellum biogenesis protein FlaJ (TadC family)